MGEKLTDEKLEKMLVEMSRSFTCEMSKMKDSIEGFKIDIRTKIKDDPEEMNKSLQTEVEAGIRNEGCERKNISDELTKLKDDMFAL